MDFPRDFTEGLNDAQKQAVLTTDGPLLIVAGAGAGKTKTIVHRMGHLITSGVAPSSILAVTFTNKAAKEMRERTLSLIETGQSAPFVSTFHSLGVFLLRKFGVYNGVKRFTVLDDADTMSLIKEALTSFGIDPKVNDPRSIKNTISRSANAFLGPEQLEGEANPSYRLAGRIWKKYKALKQEQNAVDFDDLLTETVHLLEKDKTVRDWCHSTWSHIHIDEYQDTNEVQYRIAKALASHTKNLCVVGDSDQSIYSWRGANIKNILEFERDYPEATVVVLEENYRSTKTVLAAANEIIEKNKYRTPKKLFTNNTNGENISVYTAYDETDEANFVVERCIEHMDSGVVASDIAVLFRTNFQSRVLEESFLAYHIPYHVLGVRFFERKEVKDVLCYMRAALNPESLVDIKRIINVPARGIGKVTIAKVFAKEPLSGKAELSVTKFFELLVRIRTYMESHSVSESIKYIIIESGMDAYYKDEPDGQEHLENLAELVTLGTRYDAFGAADGIEKLIEEATLMSDQDNIEAAHGVKLMTIHAAKGLEFAVVFVVGLEQGLFPHDRDRGATGADAEEERRLMYVALTRARQKLYLTYASMRTIYGMRDVRMPSEFVLDIPEELITRETRAGEAGFATVFL
ncbi:MAG: UvrD-helicase domain-containing protein [Candidatus Pacebacteria bacterium]|nr:UvrD-helicase domain-containing protein [Candidatus Paceibacterota bacterium]